jgi:hypothetical protein
MKKNKIKPKINKYPEGGFFNENPTGQFIGNMAKTYVDTPLSMLGLSNVIKDDAYKGNSSDKFIKYGNIAGKVGQAALPFALQAVGVPAPVTKAGLSVLGQFNPQNSQPQEQVYKNQGMMFTNGGVNITPNAEVEKQENSISPNGEFTQYNGPTHEAGGIKTNLEQGEIIFSDRLKPKGSTKTFAELNKKFNSSKEDKLIEDKKSNNLQKVTAQLMKEAKLRQSKSLFEEQEALKQSKVDNYAKKLGMSGNFKYGGINKYPDGGEMLPSMFEEDPSIGYKELLGQQEYQNLMGQAGQTSHWDVQGQGENPYYNSGNSGINPAYGQIAKQLGLGLAQNAGNIYDLKRSMNVDKETYNRVTPELLDSSAALRYNDMQGRLASENIKNASVGNSSTYLQNRKDLAINQMMANSNIRQQYQNQNANISNQAKYYNAGAGDRETIANMQNQAQARNLKGAAISNIGQNIMGQTRDYNAQKSNDTYNKQMSDRDKQYLQTIASRYPEIMKDPELAKLYK